MGTNTGHINNDKQSLVGQEELMPKNGHKTANEVGSTSHTYVPMFQKKAMPTALQQSTKFHFSTNPFRPVRLVKRSTLNLPYITTSKRTKKRKHHRPNVLSGRDYSEARSQLP